MSSSGTYIRTKEHRENMSRIMLESWEKRKIPRSAMSEIDRMDREELLDARAEIRERLIPRIKFIRKYWEGMMEMDRRLEKIEERLESLGMRLKGMGYHKDKR